MKLTAFLLALISSLGFAQTSISGGTITGATVGTSSIVLQITTTALPNGQVQSAYSSTITTTGGIGTQTFTITSGSLPLGITLNPTSGALTGTPTQAGSFQFVVQVTDSKQPTPQTDTKTLQISVNCPTLTVITAPTLPPGTQNQPYSVQLASNGGISPFAWVLTSGTLPTGISLTSAGLVSGTPTNTGTFSPVITVTDSCSPPTSIQTPFSLTISAQSTPLAIVTTSPLPNGTQNQAYGNFQFVSNNGGAGCPCTWDITAGSWPTGMSLSSAGVLSGTPTVTGTFTPTVRVRDNGLAHSATGVFSITVNTPSNGDNAYCTVQETSTITGTLDGPAQQIQKCVYTPMSAMAQSSPTTVTVAVGDANDLQTKLNALSCGETLIIPARNGANQAKYISAQFTLPLTPLACPSTNWAIIRTDLIASLPEGTRVNPCAINTASVTGRPSYSCPSPSYLMPQLVTNDISSNIGSASGGTIFIPAGTSHVRFIGLEITSAPNVAGFRLVAMDGTDHIIFDRSIVHIGQNAQGTSASTCTLNGQAPGAGTNGTCTFQRGIDLGDNSYNAVIDSYIYDIHSDGNTQRLSSTFTCCGYVDSFAIFGGGTGNGTEGPYKVVNNFLESSGENFFTGGGAATGIPQDYEYRRNHSFKPQMWKSDDPAYFGYSFKVKNCFELKNANRVLMEGNVFENSWFGQADQDGSCVLFTPKNPNNTDPTATVSNVTMRFNRIYRANKGINLAPVVATQGGTLPAGEFNISVHDNLFDYINGPTAGTSNPGGGCCVYAIGTKILSDILNLHDVSFIHNTFVQTLDASILGSSLQTAGAFMNITGDVNGNLWDGFTWKDNIALGGWKGQGAGGGVGQCINQSGASILTLGTLATPGCFTASTDSKGWCTAGNGLVVNPYPGSTFKANNPFPQETGQPNSPNPACPTTTNKEITDWASVGFVNFNNGNNGDYHLLSTSTLHNAASDGKDVGADIDTLNQKIAGVGGTVPQSGGGNVSLSPLTATVVVADNQQSNAGQQQFSATVAGGGSVTWQICTLTQSACFDPGVANVLGSITSSGLVTGPLVLPNPAQFLVKATNVADSTKTATATVTVDRNVHWTVTTDQAGLTPVNWATIRGSSGDKQVYYHIIKNGVPEQCYETAAEASSHTTEACYRGVLIHIGTGYTADHTKGAIMHFHGSGGSQSSCQTEAAVKTLVDSHGWVAICPLGLFNDLNSTSSNWVAYWNASGGQISAQPAFPDDSALGWAMAYDAINNLLVDANRVHAQGQSAGTFFLSRLVIDDGQLIASIAQSPGNTYGTDHNFCDGSTTACNPLLPNWPERAAYPPLGFPLPNPNYPVSVFIMMGTTDAFTSDCSGGSPGKANNIPGLGEAFDFYSRSFNCKTITPNQNPFCPFVPGQVNSSTGKITCQESPFVPGEGRACAGNSEIYKHARNCNGGVEVNAYRLFFGGHQWFNSQDICESGGTTAHNGQLAVDFPADCPVADGGTGGNGFQNTIVWDFYNTHPKVAGGSPLATLDMIDWFTLDPDLAATSHMGGTSTPTYTYMDDPNHRFWRIKNAVGNPWDVMQYYAGYIADKITEQVFSDPTTWKDHMPGQIGYPWVHRFVSYDPAQTGQLIDEIDTYPTNFDIHNTPGNCSGATTNSNLGHVKGQLWGPFTETLGGSLPPNLTTFHMYWMWSCDVNFQNCATKEDRTLTQRYGSVRWQNYSLVSGNYVLQQDVLANNLVSGTATPVHPCFP